MSSPVHSRGRGRILLTGSGGQVGRELLRSLASVGEVIAPDRAEMDLSRPEAVKEMIRRVRPRWIVNPGAYTAVDKAESEPELARAINAVSVAVMGEEAHRIGAGVVHFSTDYVFDGLKPEPYVETDATGPVSVYGATKLEGEALLAGSGAAHTVFRTSWVYGATGKNFMLTMLRLARERERLTVVADQQGSPTWSRDLARLTAEFILQCEVRAGGDGVAEAVRERGGAYHASGSGYTTWFEFASEIVAEASRREPNAHFAEVKPIGTVEFPTPAARPMNSRLCCRRLEERLGWVMMPWRESLREVMAEL